uniref:RNA polymerase sigma factor n=1 Tax=Paractinoplanes polyasparticus TaxID=2856853 RepID=UPI001C84A29E|nr:RNA polymerase sigma factor [Actinoplanes polyasparticus]
MDAELVRAASSGDEGAFAALIEGNLAGMRAVAVARLGWVDEAEDAVQDAVLTALNDLSRLREPDAAGAWLRSIVRNNCRMLLRSRRALPVADPETLLPVDVRWDPGKVVERAATRDWVRGAVAVLPDPVREVMVLRYFTDWSSYRQIAELCAIPEHTVRSRLRQGRRAFGQALQDVAASTLPDSNVMARATRHEAEALVQAGLRGDARQVLEDLFHPGALVTRAGYGTEGISGLLPMMTDTLSAGVGLRLLDTAASADTVVWDIEFLNPASDPQHCPPAMTWLSTMRQGRITQLRIAYRSEPLH